jgi:nicotinate-nucleotide adenylyltransferase
MTEFQDIKSLGILGGTFDPIHIGHTAIAREVRDAYNLDRVDLVPAYQNPLREEGSNEASPFDRLIMANLASLDYTWLYVNPIEIDRGRHIPGPSYTIDTLGNYREFAPSLDLYLIVGADNTAFHLWQDISRFPEYLEKIVVANRPDFSDRFNQNLALVKEKNPGVYSIIEVLDDIDIPKSSTNIRIKTHEGIIPVDHLHPLVEKYIRKYSLYGWKEEKVCSEE